MAKRKISLQVTVLAVAIVALLIGLRLFGRGSASAAPASSAAASTKLPEAEDAAFAARDPREPSRRAPEGKELISYLQSHFGPKLKNRYIQVKMLEQLIRMFREKQPDHWQAAILDVLRTAFPDNYAELAANLQHWIDYEQWTHDNREHLQTLSDEERRKAVWDARNNLFGKEAAEQIWASDLKNQAFSDALKSIDAQAGTLTDKLASYKSSIEDIHQEHAERFLASHRQEVMSQFLDLESVQKQLATQPAEQRAQSLREIRKGMGLDEEALKRWDALDHERDGRWDDGARYMQEREGVAKKFSGAELEQHLKELRDKHFATEADVIGQEEQSGFFRFTRSRKWGLN